MLFSGKLFHEKSGRSDVANTLRRKKYPLFFDYSSGIPQRISNVFVDVIECPMCGSKDVQKEKIRKDALLVDQCRSCSFGFQNPRVAEKMLPQLYLKENTHNYGRYATKGSQQVDFIKNGYGIEQAKLFKKDIKSVLDIGSGDYSFLKRCKDYGVETLYGIDPGCISNNKKNTEGIIHCDDFFTSSKEWMYDKVDLITLWDTLEHIIDFEEAIRSSKELLSNDGLILVMVPNFLSLATRLIREKSPTFNLQHVNYFTEQSLDYLFSKCGMSVLKKETVISEIDNCRNYIEFSDDIYMSKVEKSPIFSWLTVDFIHDNMLGSRLFYLCGKSHDNAS